MGLAQIVSPTYVLPLVAVRRLETEVLQVLGFGRPRCAQGETVLYNGGEEGMRAFDIASVFFCLSPQGPRFTYFGKLTELTAMSNGNFARTKYSTWISHALENYLSRPAPGAILPLPSD